MHVTHHHHGHDHKHEHGHAAAEMSVPEKLKKLAEHWIGHNEDHAASYRLWAKRSREAGKAAPAEILEEIALDMTEQNKKLRKIIELLAAKSTD